MINTSEVTKGYSILKSTVAKCYGFSISSHLAGVTLVLSDSATAGTTGTIRGWFYYAATQTANENFIPPLYFSTGLRAELLGGASGSTCHIRWG